MSVIKYEKPGLLTTADGIIKWHCGLEMRLCWRLLALYTQSFEYGLNPQCHKKLT